MMSKHRAPLPTGIRQLWLLPVLMAALWACAQSTTAGSAPQQQAAHSPAAAQTAVWWCYPLPGAKVISPFGGRSGRRHTGHDLKTKPNDSIMAAFDGEVVFAARYAGYGNLIRIQHPNGLETYYSHNSKNLVKAGDHVAAGQVIALTGRTGRASTEHLHFETRIGGKAVNSNRFFDHANHTIRIAAFKKSDKGYVVR